MSKSAWPTTTELNDVLTDAGIALPSFVTSADVVAQAVGEWNALTGTNPWLAASGSLYGAWNGTEILRLPYPMTAVSSLTYEGSTVDAELWDLEGVAPYTAVVMRSRYESAPNKVTIAGTVGWSATIPIEVWTAVLGRMVEISKDAAALATGSMGSGTGEVSRLKQGSVEIEYSDAPASAFGLSAMKALAGRYGGSRL